MNNATLKQIFIICSGVLWVLLTGCSYSDFRRPPLRNYLRDRRHERPPEADVSVEKIPDPTRAALRGLDTETSPLNYILGPDDVVEIKVMIPQKHEPALTFQAPVDRAGEIQCPFLGKVHVAGHSVEDAVSELTELYADGFFHQPYLEVDVKEHRSSQAMVFGHVSSPGHYAVMGERTSLLHLLLAAGGTAGEAGDRVAVIRGPASLNGQVSNDLEGATEMVDIHRLLKHGDLRHNVWVYPGDMVHVRPETPTEYYYILGFAANDAYELPDDRDIGIMGAVVSAGGLGAVSRPQYTYLMRYEDGSPTPTIYNIDLSRIASGEEPDIKVMPEDRIIVSTDWLRRGWDGLLSNLIRIRPLAQTPDPMP